MFWTFSTHQGGEICPKFYPSKYCKQTCLLFLEASSMILHFFHTLIGYCFVLKKVAKHNLKQKKEILHTIKEDGFLLIMGSKSLWSSIWHFSTTFILHRNFLFWIPFNLRHCIVRWRQFEVVKNSKLLAYGL